MPAVGWSGRFISASGDSSERSERLCFFYEYEINSVVLANEQLRPRSCPGDPFLPPHSLNPRLGSVLYVAGSLPIANPAALFSVCVPHAQNAQLLLDPEMDAMKAQIEQLRAEASVQRKKVSECSNE
ncbi:hypothetical protein L596_029941 [Steinernema carpocapsae]|uniref:G protein gamma domain-containing protein n=1 Tax=Steinernema carpocapsae TaxID=34508 RepID=A0A4V5ZX74_STECR|nr:hypothetical protein L596_029941 [Steinernema carpocapsae]